MLIFTSNMMPSIASDKTYFEFNSNTCEIKFHNKKLMTQNFEDLEALLATISLLEPKSETALKYKAFRHQVKNVFALKVASIEARFHQFKEKKENKLNRDKAEGYGDAMGIFYLELLRDRYQIAGEQLSTMLDQYKNLKLPTELKGLRPDEDFKKALMEMNLPKPIHLKVLKLIKKDTASLNQELKLLSEKFPDFLRIIEGAIPVFTSFAKCDDIQIRKRKEMAKGGTSIQSEDLFDKRVPFLF
jgi:hypothetical protein